mmetsp:Transcript_11532/g.13209  ORF Transcript_11532/g.13209 Transcript_11532/m.13209 type:complete len:293 (+) Transcript_11532:206-1084(+)|eukprot:CAMPEP_0194169124 /NCGR_PEP_ID=MMETSP0154-20130528/3805_1 /TAXON_ID=1049557 /ORGANISM="Thalassiothrix antarctica, Strain L6-D1" /LENGTH=292 /DNA_ID=CAMNT_0038880369 /DNA_START=183 /DNA_END=1061 /DNA_ORIENTATION=-
MCQGRFCAEFRLPFFGIVKPNGRTLDLDKSFSVKQHSSIWKKIAKIIILCILLATFVGQWVENEYPLFYMAYLTRWTLLYQIIYAMFSFFTTIYPMQWMIKATWVLFSLAAVHGVIIVLLFWLTEYGPDFPLTVYDIFTHGITFLCVVFDGFVVNRTPVDLKHFAVNSGFALLYITWSLIQGLVPIDNPWKEPDVSQSLYKVLDWDAEPVMSAIVGVMVVFVAVPVFHIIFWAISLPLQVYLDVYEAQETAGKVDLDDEEDQVKEAPLTKADSTYNKENKDAEESSVSSCEV